MTDLKKSGVSVMKNIRQRLLWLEHAPARAVFIVSFLLVMGGCATGNIKPEAVDDIQQTSLEPGVKHYQDGRIGFVLRETAVMDAVAHHDFERAVKSFKDEDYELAIELFDRVIEVSPAVSAPYIDLAMAYRKIDRPELAEDQLKKALDLIPGHPVASQEYGLLLRSTGRFSEAKEVYEQSLKEFPEYLPVRRNLGILCDLYLNDPECALEQYQQYSKYRPEDEQAELWVAELRLRLGR